MDNSTSNVYKFPEEVIKNEIQQAKTAGVDVKKVIQSYLTENFSMEDNGEKLDALSDDMQKSSNQLLGEIDDIVNSVIEKLNKDPEKFKILLDIIRKERIKTELESAKITLDKSLLDAIVIEPIDFKTLEVAIPAGLEKKIEDDTPEQLRIAKDYTTIGNEIVKIAPKEMNDKKDFSDFRKVLFNQIGNEIDLTKLGYTAGDLIKMNTQEYNEKGAEQRFYYINNTRRKELKCLSYSKDGGRSKINNQGESESMFCGNIRGEYTGLEDINDVIFTQVFLQNLGEIISQIEKNGGSNSEDISTKINNLYQVLNGNKASPIKNILTEKVNGALELLNRYSDKLWYYDSNRINGKIDYHYDSNVRAKIQKINKENILSSNMLSFFEKKYMQEILQQNNEIKENIEILKAHIEENENFYDEKEIKIIVDNIIYNIVDIDGLSRTKKNKNDEAEGITNSEIEQLKKSFLDQLQVIMNLWNRKDKGRFHYVTKRNNYIQLESDYIFDNLSRDCFKKDMLNSEDTLLYYEKQYFQRATHYISLINNEIENIKTGKSKIFTESGITHINGGVSVCVSDLTKIRRNSPLKEMANILIETLHGKMQILSDLLNQDEKAKKIYIYEKQNRFGEDYYYGGSKLGKINTNTQLYQNLLQEYSTGIAQEYITFQNKFADANTGEDNLEKIDKLLTIKKSDWDTIISKIQELLNFQKGPGKENVQEVLTLLKSQRAQTLDTIMKILSEINKTLELYTKNDIKGIPNLVYKTIKDIRGYKEKTEKQYPDANTLGKLAEVRSKIDNQKDQLNNFISYRDNSNKKHSEYDKLLGEISHMKEDTEDGEYIRNNSILKKYLYETKQRQAAITSNLESSTNTHAKNGFKLLQEEYISYMNRLSEKIGAINKILDDRYISSHQKEDAQFSISEVASLNEIFEEFKTQRGAIKDSIEDKQKEELYNQLQNTETIKNAYIQFLSLCKLTNTDINKFDKDQSINEFNLDIHSLVRTALGLPALKNMKEESIMAQIKSFIDWKKEIFAFPAKFLQEKQMIQKTIIEQFLSGKENFQGLEKDTVAKWLEQSSENEDLEQNKLDAYHTYMKNLVLNTLDGKIDNDIRQHTDKRNKEHNQGLREKRKEKQSLFINMLNTKSLLDYTDLKSTQREYYYDEVIDKIKKDESIKTNDRHAIEEGARELRNEYLDIAKRSDKQYLSLTEAVDPAKPERINELYDIYSHEIPRDKIEEFKEILRMIGRWEKSGFTGELNRELANRSNEKIPLVDMISFSKLMKKVDLTNQLELRRWKKIIITKLISRIEGEEQKKLTGKRIEEYIDTVLALPPDILKDEVNMKNIEKHKDSMPNYVNIIEPVRSFEEDMTKKPEEALQRKAEECVKDQKLKDIRSSYNENENLEKKLKENMSKFVKNLNLNTEEGIKDAMDVLKETFPNNESIKNNYADFISFGKMTVMSLRKSKILKTLDPEKLFKDAIEKQKTESSLNKKRESDLLKSAIKSIADDLFKIEKMIKSITSVFNTKVQIDGKEKLAVISSDKLLKSETREDFEKNMNLFIQEYTELVKNINENYIQPLVKEKFDTDYKDVKDMEAVIEKLRKGSFDSMKEFVIK